MLFSLGFQGCDGQEDPLALTSIPQKALAVPFQPVEGATSILSGVTDRRRLVIRDSEEWGALWDELQAYIVPKSDAPPVDFDRRMVIAASLGRKPTGGHSIAIESVHRGEGKLFVVVKETSPGLGCLTTQAITAPATAVSVERFDGSVTFIEEAETKDCM